MDDDSNSYQEPVHESTFVLTLKIVILQVIIICLSILVALLLVNILLSTSTTGAVITANVVANSVLQLINAALLVYVVSQWRNTSYIINPDEIIVRQSAPSARTRIYRTANIEEIEVRKSLLGKLFNYGTVSFLDSALGDRIELVNIPRPEHYARIIENKIRSMN